MSKITKEDISFAKRFAVGLISISLIMFVFGLSGWGWPLVGLILVGPTLTAEAGVEKGKSSNNKSDVVPATTSSDPGGCDGC